MNGIIKRKRGDLLIRNISRFINKKIVYLSSYSYEANLEQHTIFFFEIESKWSVPNEEADVQQVYYQIFAELMYNLQST